MNPDFPEDFVPQGIVELPSSKSLVNRLLILSSLAGSSPPLQRVDEADDVQLMRQVLSNSQNVVDVGMAGTVCRFVTAWLTVQKGTYQVTGAPRMLERPIGVLVDALLQLGANIEYLGEYGFLPLKINGGHLAGGSVPIAGDISSQYLSALLMIAPYMKNGLILEVKPPFYSKPYVRMTTKLMERSGVKVHWEDKVIKVAPGAYSVVPASIESDWSAASFFYSLLALSGKGHISLRGLYNDSLQGDSVCQQLFGHFGVITTFDDVGAVITVREKRLLPDSMEINCSDFPDLVQPLACTCAGLRVKVRFTGVKSLRIKETDRVAALQSELAKLGVTVTAGSDHLEIAGFEEPTSFLIETHNDHRMAMAFAPLGIIYPHLEILDHEVVSKSFPMFWQELRNLFSQSER